MSLWFFVWIGVAIVFGFGVIFPQKFKGILLLIELKWMSFKMTQFIRLNVWMNKKVEEIEIWIKEKEKELE